MPNWRFDLAQRGAFCPNAFTLDALFKQQEQPSPH
jgi:hypothetical protein